MVFNTDTSSLTKLGVEAVVSKNDLTQVDDESFLQMGNGNFLIIKRPITRIWNNLKPNYAYFIGAKNVYDPV